MKRGVEEFDGIYAGELYIFQIKCNVMIFHSVSREIQCNLHSPVTAAIFVVLYLRCPTVSVTDLGHVLLD